MVKGVVLLLSFALILAHLAAAVELTTQAPDGVLPDCDVEEYRPDPEVLACVACTQCTANEDEVLPCHTEHDRQCTESETPAPVTPQPVTPQPVTPQPVTPQPVTPQPVTPQPVTPQPVTPQPVTPQPVTPQPVTPVPATPEPDAETPEPVEETPAPDAETPEPVEETPAPDAETPEPVEETPAPDAETPEPVEETPAPDAETPEPVEETPAPDMVTLAPTLAPEDVEECQAGEYRPAGRTTCLPCLECSDAEEEIVPCTTSHNRQCADMTTQAPEVVVGRTPIPATSGSVDVVVSFTVNGNWSAFVESERRMDARLAEAMTADLAELFQVDVSKVTLLQLTPSATSLVVRARIRGVNPARADLAYSLLLEGNIATLFPDLVGAYIAAGGRLEDLSISDVGFVTSPSAPESTPSPASDDSVAIGVGVGVAAAVVVIVLVVVIFVWYKKSQTPKPNEPVNEQPGPNQA